MYLSRLWVPVCSTCMQYLYAVPVCSTCMQYLYAVPVCSTCMQDFCDGECQHSGVHSWPVWIPKHISLTCMYTCTCGCDIHACIPVHMSLTCMYTCITCNGQTRTVDAWYSSVRKAATGCGDEALGSVLRWGIYHHSKPSCVSSCPDLCLYPNPWRCIHLHIATLCP